MGGGWEGIYTKITYYCFWSVYRECNNRQLWSQWQWSVIFLRLWIVYREASHFSKWEEAWKDCNLRVVLGEWIFSFGPQQRFVMLQEAGGLRAVMGGRYGPRRKTGMGLDLELVQEVGFSWLQVRKALDILMKKGPHQSSGRLSEVLVERVNQEECLSAVGFIFVLLVLSLREFLKIFNYVGKLYAKQLWCLQKCLNEYLVNAKILPFLHLTIMMLLLGLWVIYIMCLHTNHSFTF